MSASPGSRPSAGVLLRSLRRTHGVRSRRFRPNVPSDAAALITALTAKDPGNRPNKARETSERAAGLYAGTAGGIAPCRTSQEAVPTDRRD
jgi:hypothetical protein